MGAGSSQTLSKIGNVPKSIEKINIVAYGVRLSGLSLAKPALLQGEFVD
jgi:hypothetical protein